MLDCRHPFLDKLIEIKPKVTYYGLIHIKTQKKVNLKGSWSDNDKGKSLKNLVKNAHAKYLGLYSFIHVGFRNKYITFKQFPSNV